MDRQIIINDLVARIPYGVVVNCTDGDVQLISVDFEKGYDNPEFWHDGPGSNINFDDDNIKPYLFPLSTMTKEQKEEYKYITERWMYDPSYSIGDSIDWLNKNHFDYRGLIPAGDAIDATGLKIY